MQTQAPSGAERIHAPTRHLFEMTPGSYFIAQPNREALPAPAEHSVLSLLSNQGTVVADNARIWCVVIAAGAKSGTRAGELLALPRDAIAARVSPGKLEFALGD
jgi:hypothetical protein